MRRRNGNNIIAIASGKGGVGKTTVTANLAWALAETGRRTLILDADFGLSNADILLGVHPDKSLEDVLFEDLPIEEAILPVSDSLDLLSGSSGVARMAELNRKQRARLLREFKKLSDYDFILIDNSPGINGQIVSLCLSARDIVIVATPEAASLTDAYALIKVLRENGLWWSPLVLINRAADKAQAEWVFDRLRSTAGEYLKVECALLGYILEDPKAQAAARARKPVLAAAPKCPASVCLRGCAASLAGRAEARGREVTPERFWDNSVMLFQQRPRFDLSARPAATGEGRLPPELVRLVDNFASIVDGLHSAPDPAALDMRLASVQAALAQLRARIRYPSDPATGAGTGLEDEGRDEPIVPEPAPELRRRAVIIAADPSMRDFFADLAGHLGFAISPTAGDPAGVALLLIDWPGGDEGLRQALERFPDTPAVILRGRLQSPGFPDLPRAAFVRKPFNLDDLRAAIARTVG